MSTHETSEDKHNEAPSVWMYAGIVIVSTAAFYITLLITKLVY